MLISRWYAVQVRAKSEQVVSRLLREKGYDDFLPMSRSWHRWSDRMRDSLSPLFPGYVFCRHSAGVTGLVVTTPGVIRIVGSGKTPTPVDDAEIASIRRLMELRLSVDPFPYLSVGQVVRIERGPLTGIQGIIVRYKNTQRLVVSVGVLQRSVAAEVDLDWVIPENHVPCNPT